MWGYMWYDVGMRHPTTHNFLKWFGSSFVVFLGAVVGLQAALAPTYPGIKTWGEDWFYYVWPIMTAPWFIVLAVFGIGGYIWALVYTGKQPTSELSKIEAISSINEYSALQSPIAVHDQLYIDTVDTVDKDGQKIEGVKAVYLCLWVTNALENGDVLRNVQARLFHISGESYLLPIRDFDDGTTNIRHGEAVKIEVGNVLVPSDPTPQAMYRFGSCIIDRGEAENTQNGWRTLHVTNATGTQRMGIGAISRISGAISYPNIRIIISADNVVSRTVWLDAYLYEESPHDWLIIKSEFSDAEPK